MMTEKRCTKCGETKSVEMFYRAANKKDGRKHHCKSCSNAQKLRWLTENRKRERERVAKWRVANPGKVRDQAASWCITHGDSVRAQLAAWKAANPDRKRQADAIYKAAYRVANREVIRAATQQRRARLRGGEVENFTDTEIFIRDGWVCQLCGDPIARDLHYPDPMSVSLDHVVPISKGGHHTRANVQTAHLRCNISKGNRVDVDSEVA
jgi:5-methylcytosine-specific restriction endonuclease McrA